MGYVLGIDLGTTYSAAATHRDGRAQIVSIGSRTAAVPSVVFLREDDAILTGEAAERRALTEPARVAREFKRRLGDSTPIMVGGTPYSAEQLSAELLRSIVGQVVALEGSRPDHIAVCHPANWGPYKRELMQQAVELAGLTGGGERITFLAEPEAAAIHYASTEALAPGELLAVYDLGGGTFDASVLRKTASGFEMLGDAQGIERLGGIDFDAAVLNHVRLQLGGKLEALDPDDPTSIAAAARLVDECIEAKEALSSDSETTIPVLLPNAMTEIRITRSEFESMIRPALAQSIGAMERTLASAKVEASDISRVLLVGGSSRIPLVAQLVSESLGRPVVADAHPKHAIALGAAIAAAAASGGLDTAAAADTTVLVDVTEEASLTRSAAAAAVVAGATALPHPAAAGWEPDPTDRHQYRYFDGMAWTDDVADAGVASRDPIADAVTSAVLEPVTITLADPDAPPAVNPGAPPPPANYVRSVHDASSTAGLGGAGGPVPPYASSAATGAPGGPPAAKKPDRGRLVLVAVLAVVLLAGAVGVAMALGDDGNSGDQNTLANESLTIPVGGAASSKPLHVLKGQVLLIKALPNNPDMDPIVSLTADFVTIDRFKTRFSLASSRLSVGARKLSDVFELSDASLTDVVNDPKGGGASRAVFVVSSTGSEGQPKALVVPIPFDIDLSIVVSGFGGAGGTVELQTAAQSFPVPKLDDGGATYSNLVDKYYQDFLQGKENIADTRAWTPDEVVSESDFSSFASLFTDFTDFTDATDATDGTITDAGEAFS